MTILKGENIRCGRLMQYLSAAFCENKLPFVSALIFGFAAHAFMLTNKIPYGDDLVAMFDKGATTVSGRYGLELLRLVLPDVSMPWIYGLLTQLLLALAVCFVIKLFRIQSPVLQILLAGVFVSFPAQAATMMYMFTVVPYALALTLSIAGLWYFACDKKLCWLVSPFLIAFSCSIYQGYFSFASSFCVILMIKALVNGEKDSKETFKYGLRLLAMLLIALAVYGVSILIFSKLLNFPIIEDVINEKQSVIMRIAVAYSAYLKTLFASYFAYVRSLFSSGIHLALVCAAALAAISKLRGKDYMVWMLTALCLFIFPLSCYCLYMLADNSYIHSLALYSFASLYVLCACLLDSSERAVLKNIASVCLALIMLGNIYYANAWYLRNYMKFEELKSMYQSVITQVISTPGFDEKSKIALVGNTPEQTYNIDENFDMVLPQTPSLDIESTDYAQLIVSRYLGFDIPFAAQEEVAELAANPEVVDMSIYPYDGSVRKLGDYIVVKFAE